MITREQCMQWGEEAGCTGMLIKWAEPTGKPDYSPFEETITLPANAKQLESLCHRVWNEAIEAAELEASGDYGNAYVAEAIRKLKVTK